MFTKENILNDLIIITEEMTSQWDLEFSGGLSGETRLFEDLEFESINLAQLAVNIGKKFHKPSLPFEELLMKEDSNNIYDITLNNIVDFLYKNINPS